MACLGAEKNNSPADLACLVHAFMKIKYQDIHRDRARGMFPRIGGIKVVVSTITPSEFEQECQDSIFTCLLDEMGRLFAPDKSFGFISVYRNSGALIYDSTIHDTVSAESPLFFTKQFPGEALAVGLQKKRMAVCLLCVPFVLILAARVRLKIGTLVKSKL
jgi:hypothetical protein